MKDLDDRLTEHLHAQAGHLSITPAALDRVVARGRRRQRRARAAAGAMAAIAVVAGVAGYQASRPDRSSFKVSVGDAPTTNDRTTEGAATTVTTEVDHAVPGTSTDGTAAANTPAPVGGGAAPLPQATIGGTGLSWQRKNPKSTIGANYGNPGGPVTIDGRLVALSTAPAGATPAGSNGVFRFDTLYSTADGIEWSPSKAPTWLSSLGGRGSQLFGVGTAPADVATSLGITEGAPIVGSSTDGGKTWTTAALPVAADAGPRGTRQGVGMGASLVAGPKGVLVTQTSYRQAYLADLVPAGVDTSWGVTTSPAGVSVLAKPANLRPDVKVCPKDAPVLKAASDLPATFGAGTDTAAAGFGLSPWVCTGSGDPAVNGGGFIRLRFDQLGYPVAHTYTWSELGTSWERLVTNQPVEHTYYSTDGRTFDPVTLPGSPNSHSEIAADADGFLAVSYVQPDFTDVRGAMQMTMITYRSTDGRTWTEGTPMPGVAGGGSHPGRLADGRWVMSIQARSGSPRLLVSSDGLDWQQLGLDDVIAAAVGPNMQGNIGLVDVGPTGITAAVFTSPDIVAEHGGVKVSANGITMTITNARGAVTITDDASGTVLGTASIWGGESTPLLRIDQVPADAASRGPTTIADCPSGRPDGCAVTPQVPEYVVLDPATGAERARFTGTQIDQAMAPVNIDQRPWSPRALILTSVDGSSWAVTDLTEVAGEPITLVDGIDHVGDKVIVRAQTKRLLPGSDANNPAFAQLALVGTAKG